MENQDKESSKIKEDQCEDSNQRCFVNNQNQRRIKRKENSRTQKKVLDLNTKEFEED